MKKLLLLLFFTQIILAQNTCQQAQVITGSGNYVISSINGTDVPNPICSENGPVDLNPAGEWYKYTPTENHTITISSDISQNNPRVDTRVHVYVGACGNLTCHAGDDDSGLNFSSVVTFNAIANTTYIIAWDNKWTSNGFTFSFTEGVFVPEPVAPITYTNQNISSVNSDYNLCVVDMNGDFKDDIVGVSSNNLKIHYQGNGGAFTIASFTIPGQSKMPSWSIAAGDYNKDGFNDLLLGSSDGLSFWKSNSTGTAYSSVTPGQYIFCQRTNFVDINNDGNLDAFSCHDIAPNVYYLNNGAGGFTYYQSGVTPGAYSLGITSSGGNYASLWTDYDNDGDVDMFISKCSGPPCELHRNDGNGVFTDVSALAQINTIPVQSWSSAIADFDNDGDMDIMVGSNGNVGHMLFRNNLDTTNNTEEAFTNITVGSGLDTNTNTNRDYVAYDFDNDGLVDILGGGNKILFNQGNNVFTAISYSGMAVGAIGDLNDDGFLDILNGSNVKYAVPNANNWIKVSIKGVSDNINGIGARVEIYGSFGKQIRDIRSGEGFGYMSTLNAHFGIGLATAVTKVVIKWPSGLVDVINNPAINQRLTVTEGSSLGVANYTNTAFSLYPNPVKQKLNIKWDSANLNLKTAQIFDLNGRLLLKSININQPISVETLSAGTYILLLKDENGKEYSQKFIKE